MPHISASHNREKTAAQGASFGAALQALQVENAALKTRLAESIRLCADDGQLDALEEFQGRFLVLDTAIALLRREVAVKRISEDGILAQDLQRMRKEFGLLRKEFEGYLIGQMLKG